MSAQRIREELEGVACIVCGESTRWKFHGSPQSRLNSVTAVVDCASCDARFFLKKLSVSGGAVPGALALEEFDAAQRVHAAYPSNSDFGVVTPFQVIAEKGLLFFGYVEGRNATELLLELGTDRRIGVLERIGAWLRRFHDSTKPSEGSADLQERLHWLQARLVDNCPSSRAFGSTLAFLTDEVRQLDDNSSRIVGLHGDCKPENFLVRGTQVIGIDVAWRHRYVAEYDLSQFLAQLALFARSLRGARLMGSDKQLESAFLRGYGIDSAVSIRLINWFKAYYFLSYWLSWRKRGYLQRLSWDTYFAFFLRRFVWEPAYDDSPPIAGRP